MASLTPTRLLCNHSITQAGEVLNERYGINSLLLHKEAVTSKYFSLECVSQSHSSKSKFRYVVWVQNLA